MQNKWKLILGIIFCIIGITIILTNLLMRTFIPGGFASLVLGIILISISRE